MSRPWRPGVAVGEGIRAALTGRWLSAVIVLLICWAGALPGAVDAMTVADLVAAEARFLDAGGTILVAENRDAGLPAQACERLAGGDGVHASAALSRIDEPATVSVARGADLPVFAATGGIWQLLGVQTSPTRAGIVPASTADRLGLSDGDWLQLERSPGTEGHWVPTEPIQVTVANMEILGDELTGVLLPTTIAPDTTAQTCVVAAESAQLPALREALPATLATGQGQVVVRDRLFTGEFSADHSTTYGQRPLQWAWAATGTLLGLLWLLMRWVRRADDALYATMGADAITRLLIRATEWATLAGLGGLWAITLGVITAMSQGTPYPTALTYVSRHIGPSLLLATTIMLLGQAYRPGSLLADLKDR